MSDGSDSSPAGRDQRIDVAQQAELRKWAEKLEVTEGELRSAVEAVGDRLDDLREYFRREGGLD